MACDMKGAVNYEARNLFSFADAQPLGVAPRDIRTDVDVADGGHAGSISPHPERDYVGRSGTTEILAIQFFDRRATYEGN